MAAIVSSPLADETRTTQHALDLVRSAIALAASGGARRVTLVQVESVERILAEAQVLAREYGVIVRPLWRPTRVGCDIAVEPVG